MQARLNGKKNSGNPFALEQQNGHLTISIIKQAADEGNRESLDALTETGAALGLGFASLIDIFNPEKIILGGPISIVGKYLLPSIIDTASSHSFTATNPNAEILLSSFKTDAVLIGAISIIVDDVLSNPTHVERR